MWMVNPKKMCRKHLVAEHCELHMFTGSIRLKKSLEGYIQKGIFEPVSIIKRHNDLVKEFERRGYNHKTPLNKIEVKHLKKCCTPFEPLKIKVSKKKSLEDLVNRCKECKKNFS